MALRIPEKLFEDMKDTILTCGCQFWACRGPRQIPEDMSTCYRCWTLYEMRQAGVLTDEEWRGI